MRTVYTHKTYKVGRVRKQVESRLSGQCERAYVSTLLLNMKTLNDID